MFNKAQRQFDKFRESLNEKSLTASEIEDLKKQTQDPAIKDALSDLAAAVKAGHDFKKEVGVIASNIASSGDSEDKRLAREFTNLVSGN